MPCCAAAVSAGVLGGHGGAGPRSHQRVVVQCEAYIANYASRAQLLWTPARMSSALFDARQEGEPEGHLFAGAPHPAGAGSAKGFQRAVLREWSSLRANLPSSMLGPRLRDAVRALRHARVFSLNLTLPEPNTLRANQPSSIWVRGYETRWRVLRCAMNLISPLAPYPRLARETCGARWWPIAMLMRRSCLTLVFPRAILRLLLPSSVGLSKMFTAAACLGGCLPSRPVSHV